MELNIRPALHNQFPLNGLLIKGNDLATWFCELERMHFSYDAIAIYPLPGIVPNSVWGCFIHVLKPQPALEIGKNEYVQQVSPNVFIAEKAAFFPPVTQLELQYLFPTSTWLFHPELGLVEMTQRLDFTQVLTKPSRANLKALKPEEVSRVPKSIKSFQIAPVDVEKALASLEAKIVPKQEKLEDKPLSVFEKLKMAFYKLQLGKGDGGATQSGERVSTAQGNKTGNKQALNTFGKLIGKLTRPFRNKSRGDYETTLQEDLAELEKRNQKELDKLLDMLKNNPEEALKYAIPLDTNGSSRGTEQASLKITRNWSSLSLFGNNTQQRTSSGSINLGENFHVLQEQYRKTAHELKEQKAYEKAAFVYMKLLKDYHSAAITLVEGKFYSEAASIYTKHLKDQNKAAECYLNGKMYANAIEIYKDQKEYEKVGDVYAHLNQRKEADAYFEQAALKHRNASQFLKSAAIYKEKMFRVDESQRTLLEGWKADNAATECLKKYFAEYETPEELENELLRIYKDEVNSANQGKFLQVLKTDAIHTPLSETTRELAYEIVSKEAKNNPSIVKELNFFNTANKGLPKDAVRYYLGRNGNLPKR